MSKLSALVALILTIGAQPARADDVYWQCASFARVHSGLRIYGDAHRWWQLAEGRYVRGSRPRTGAVLAFTPTGTMRLGHVATVSHVVSPREIDVTHANWSPFGGRRGYVEHDVQVRDVSVLNDWSAVRVWYAPSGQLGTTHYSVTGFIYNERATGPTTPPPRLEYARLDTLDVRPRRARLIGHDVVRLARLELRRVVPISMPRP